MRIVYGVLALVLCAILLCSFEPKGAGNGDYLRIHIRANSNSAHDQSVKYAVKDAIVQALMQPLSACTTKAEAQLAIANNLHLIEQTANRTMLGYGFSYQTKAFLATEFFPTRSYEGLTLESGVYDALILELGEAKGDNWWCVVYPPLCFVPEFTSGNNIVYKSKLLQIIQNFFAK